MKVPRRYTQLELCVEIREGNIRIALISLVTLFRINRFGTLPKRKSWHSPSRYSIS